MAPVDRELVAAEYPPRLRDLRKPPPRLWVRGELPRGPAVAIVGTRKATPQGVRFTEDLARALASVGVTILSGGAVGIDAAAHRGALDAGGTTVVVSPAGLGAEFPEENHPLFSRIVESGGAILSSFPPNTPAHRFRFLTRNAQLAALSHALVVVETALIGGARNAVASARRLGRPVLVVPGAPWAPRSVGCLHELRAGARLLLSADDVLEAIELPPLRPRRRGSRRRGPAPEESDPVRARVLTALARGPLHPESLCGEAAVPPAELQALLLTLTLEGIVVSDPSGRVLLVSS